MSSTISNLDPPSLGNKDFNTWSRALADHYQDRPYVSATILARLTAPVEYLVAETHFMTVKCGMFDAADRLNASKADKADKEGMYQNKPPPNDVKDTLRGMGRTDFGIADFSLHGKGKLGTPDPLGRFAAPTPFSLPTFALHTSEDELSVHDLPTTGRSISEQFPGRKLSDEDIIKKIAALTSNERQRLESEVIKAFKNYSSDCKHVIKQILSPECIGSAMLADLTAHHTERTLEELKTNGDLGAILNLIKRCCNGNPWHKVFSIIEAVNHKWDRPKESLTQYLARVDRLLNQLKEDGTDMTNNIIIFAVVLTNLSSDPSLTESLRKYFTDAPDETNTYSIYQLSKTVLRWANAESRIVSSRSHRSYATANVAVTPKAPRSHESQDKFCAYCLGKYNERNNHKTEDCRRLKWDTAKSSSPSNNPEQPKQPTPVSSTPSKYKPKNKRGPEKAKMAVTREAAYSSVEAYTCFDFASDGTGNNLAIVDTGATRHFVHDPSLLLNTRKINPPVLISTAKGLTTSDQEGSLPGVGLALVLPEVGTNLISFRQAVQDGHRWTINDDNSEFTLHRAGYTPTIFKFSEGKGFTNTIDALSSNQLALSTAAGNAPTLHFTKKELERAQEIMRLHVSQHHLSFPVLKEMLANGAFGNTSLTAGDVDVAMKP